MPCNPCPSTPKVPSAERPGHRCSCGKVHASAISSNVALIDWLADNVEYIRGQLEVLKAGVDHATKLAAAPSEIPTERIVIKEVPILPPPEGQVLGSQLVRMLRGSHADKARALGLIAEYIRLRSIELGLSDHYLGEQAMMQAFRAERPEGINTAVLFSPQSVPMCEQDLIECEKGQDIRVILSRRLERYRNLVVPQLERRETRFQALLDSWAARAESMEQSDNPVPELVAVQKGFAATFRGCIRELGTLLDEMRIFVTNPFWKEKSP